MARTAGEAKEDTPVVNAQLASVATKVLKIAGALVALYAVITAALFAVMLQSPDKFAGTMKYVPWPAFVVLPFKPLWNVARNGHLAVGDMAPDFSLESPDHKQHVSVVVHARAETGGPGFRQLHLTSFPAGGSRSQQALRTI